MLHEIKYDFSALAFEMLENVSCGTHSQFFPRSGFTKNRCGFSEKDVHNQKGKQNSPQIKCEKTYTG